MIQPIGADHMKLNTWQILGIILLIVVVVLLARKPTSTSDVVNTTPATTQR